MAGDYMKSYTEILDMPLPNGIFTRRDLYVAARAWCGAKETQMRGLLERFMKCGRVSRVGRGRYVAGSTLPSFVGDYSRRALETAQEVSDANEWLDFRMWELGWLNEFLNHQLSASFVFVETERDGTEFAFEAVAARWRGETLLRPTADELLRYGRNGTIVVKDLFSDPPPGGPEAYHVGLEKIVVDMLCDRLLRDILPLGDYVEAFYDMFTRYSVDQVSMMRYARRRGKADMVRSFLEEEASIRLYV